MLNNILTAIANSLPIFVTMAIVLYLRRAKQLPSNTREVLGVIIFKVMVPFLLIDLLYGLKLGADSLILAIIVVIVLTLLVLVVVIISKILKWPNKLTGSIVLASMAFSVGSFAYPFVQLNFSTEVFQNLVIADTVTFLCLLLTGPFIALYYGSKRENVDAKGIVKKLFSDPIIISMLISFAINLTGITLPETVLNLCNFISRGFGFLVIVFLTLAIKIPKRDQIGFLVGAFAFRSIFILGILFVLFGILNVGAMSQQVLILNFITPFSFFPVIYAQDNDLNIDILAQLSISSILICLVVYPILMAIL